MQTIALTVLVTRPSPTGKALCQSFAQLGMVPIYVPTIEIVSLTHTVLFQQQLAVLERSDWIIFVSPQAVMHAAPFMQNLPATVKIAAIGAGTANALISAHLVPTVYPVSEWSSEGLLKLPEFQELGDQCITLVQGEGGRELLSSTLSTRGAQVNRLIAYRRSLPLDVDLRDCLTLLHEQRIDVIVSTSAESLSNLVTLVGQQNKALLQRVPVLTSSQRLAALAKEMGFGQILLAENAGSDAIINVLRVLDKRTYHDK